jgi:type VI protein secretion system component VasK
LHSFTQACARISALADPAPLLTEAAHALASHVQAQEQCAIAADAAAAAAAATISQLRSQVGDLQQAAAAAESKCVALEAKAAAQQSAAAEQLAQALAKAHGYKVRCIPPAVPRCCHLMQIAGGSRGL